MTATESKSPGVAAYYDKAAAKVPAFTVLNYGYSSEPENSVVPEGHAEFYCLRLYEHTVRAAQLTGANVLEVSCGRGGGASFLYSAFKPKRYIGIDLSAENIRMASARRDGPQFAVGNAEQLALDDGSFDIVVNIEASHLYDDRRKFFAEVFRVLTPGGSFCYTDGCWADDDCSDDLLAAGFALKERLEITDNVIRALELDSERKARLFDAMGDAKLIQEYKDWGGVVGFRAHQRFVERKTRYFSHLLLRP
jgi:SAM-dependent methyltransferase